MTIHYVNLTRGLLCPVPPDGFRHYSRIQSTHCEQKYWPGVISGAGPDMLMNLAHGELIMVHDWSERNRTTRALWQGLGFVRRTCQTFWDAELTPVFSRGGQLMDSYLDGQVKMLEKPVVNYVRYYKQFYTGAPVRAMACQCWKEADNG